MRKNLIDKLCVDKDNHEYLTENYIEGGRFKLFSNIFFGKFGAMARANWMVLLFCIPAFAALFYAYYKSIQYAAFTPFSGNLGIGYPIVPNAEEIYAELIYRNDMFRALLLVPCIIIGFVGLAGSFNVIKYESLGIDVKVFKTFFKGVKNNFVTHIWLGLINSLLFLLLVFTINGFGIRDLNLAVKIISIILVSIICAFSVIMSMYIMTQSALYDLPLSKMIKNSFRLTFSFILQNVIILIFSSVPVALLFLMNLSYFLQLIVIMVCALLGFSFIVCVWTIYNHYVYYMLFTAAIEEQSGKKKNKRKAVPAEGVQGKGKTAPAEGKGKTAPSDGQGKGKKR